MRAQLLSGAMLLLAACVPASQPDVATRAGSIGTALPPMKQFASVTPTAPQRSNRDLAADFLELSFQMESGRDLPILTRFETPITVRVTGRPPATLGPDLDRLIRRLRSEAQIQISRTDGDTANITIQAVSRRDIQKVLPQAACFVAPNVTSLAQFRSARRKPVTNWALLQTRERLAIFLPNDASPQEVRDCLHEELAQALGPLNDLYRLPDSVFNDDNVHTVLTGFDMLMLRAYYDPALRSGMSRAQVAEALPGILSRIHPAGAKRASRGASYTPKSWSQAIQTALGRKIPETTRRTAASEAIRIAQQMGWTDHRRAFAHYAMGRVLQSTNPAEAQRQYQIADRFYERSPGTTLHRAYVATQLAAFSVSQGNGAAALQRIAPHLRAAKASENAALLATLLLLQSEALELVGRASEARSVRLDSIGWARYGFGPDWVVRAKLREIASLSPPEG